MTKPKPKLDPPCAAIEVVIGGDGEIAVLGLEQLSAPILRKLAIEVSVAFLRRKLPVEMRGARSDLHGAILGRTSE